MKITANNYFTAIDSVDVDAMPEALKTMHNLFTKVTGNGQNMDSYKSNANIVKHVELYIDKLNQWADKQQAAEDKKAPAKPKVRKTQSARKTGRKAKPKRNKKAVPVEVSFLRFDSFKRALYISKKGTIFVDVDGKLHTVTAKGEPNLPAHNLIITKAAPTATKWVPEFKPGDRAVFTSKSTGEHPGRILAIDTANPGTYLFKGDSWDDADNVNERSLKKETKSKKTAKQKAAPKSPKPEPAPDNRTKVAKVPVSVAYINRYRLMNGKSLPKQGRGSLLSFLNSLQKAMTEKVIQKNDNYIKEIRTMEASLVSVINGWKGNAKYKIVVENYDHYMDIVRSYVVAPLTMLIKRFIKIQGKTDVKKEAANLVKAIEKHIDLKEISKPDVVDMLASLNQYIDGKTTQIKISPAALNGLMGLAGYKWKPSKAQRRAFAEKMNDPAEKAAYEARKEAKAKKRRAGSKFDYASAGGNYVPTKAQHDFCLNHYDLFKTAEERSAASDVMYGYSTNEKVHHDQIHIVNEIIRANPNLSGFEQTFQDPDKSIREGDFVETPMGDKGTVRRLTKQHAFLDTDSGTHTVPRHMIRKVRQGAGVNGVINSMDLKVMQFDSLGMQGKYRELIGDPAEPWSMMIYGAPGSGKSTLSIELAHYLAANHGRRVAYVAKEEGIGATIQEKFARLNAFHANIDIHSNRLPDHPEQYQYIFIDSVNEFGIEYEQLSALQHTWKAKGINPVYIFKGTKDGSFRGSQEFEHLVDVSVKTEDGIARTEKSRFGGKGALVVYKDDAQNIPKFSDLIKAEGYRNKAKGKMHITLGEDGKYWVITPAMADLMRAQGFEIF